MNKEKWDKVFIVVLLSILILFGFIVYFLFTEGSICIKNPFSYGANNFKGDVYCSCIVTEDQVTQFNFNKTDLWQSKAGENNFVFPIE